MQVSVERVGSWRDVLRVARVTTGSDAYVARGPSAKWKIRMLLAEHSPVRCLGVSIVLENIKSWMSVHLTRHKVGVEHFVRTQRSDRTGIPRDDLPQSDLVTHAMTANAQAIINISRKRLCAKASPETRAAWQKVVASLYEVEPELFSVCVPDCIYRGWCYELEPCGYVGTEGFRERLERYRSRTVQAERSKCNIWDERRNVSES